MSFVTKEWKDRLAEFAGRRKLTNVSTGEEMIVDVARNEGAVSQEGDAFSATNMNDLEQRVADEFNNINTNLTNTHKLDWDNKISIPFASGESVTFTAEKDGILVLQGGATSEISCLFLKDISLDLFIACDRAYISGSSMVLESIVEKNRDYYILNQYVVINSIYLIPYK